ncbi:MAG: LapA family protein [Firmicutes bacterium]|nr:LapA family protein [Candidatus Fermentithermobacillaceae bacterium]
MLLVVIALLILVVVFAVQNAGMVELSFLVWSVELNLALVVLASLCIGVLVGAVWVWVKSFGLKRRVHELETKLVAEMERAKELEDEVQKLKTYDWQGSADRERESGRKRE